MFRQLEVSLSRPNGQFSRLTLRLETELCMAITKARKWEEILQNNDGWPHIFHFPTVHSRVLRLKPDLERLLSRREEKDSCIIYESLLADLHEQGYGDDLSKRLRYFSSLHPFHVSNAIIKKARPG